jgi:hypothetical protein
MCRFCKELLTVRLHFRSFARPVAVVLLVGSAAFAQAPGPLQERILGQRIDVPPINERINIAPINDGTGAFTAPPGINTSRIFGVVINEMGIVVPSAGFVIVRSLRDGKVIGQTEVDKTGQFNLPGVDPGLYAAEVVDPSGSVLASSPSFTVDAGEIVQLTPVVSNSSLSGLTSLMGSSTAGAVNSAVNAGVLALDPRDPISP